MIKSIASAITSHRVAILNINYEEAKLDPPDGYSQIKVLTKDRRVESIIIREYDEDGNLISSGVYYS